MASLQRTRPWQQPLLAMIILATLAVAATWPVASDPAHLSVIRPTGPIATVSSSGPTYPTSEHPGRPTRISQRLAKRAVARACEDKARTESGAEAYLQVRGASRIKRNAVIARPGDRSGTRLATSI